MNTESRKNGARSGVNRILISLLFVLFIMSSSASATAIITISDGNIFSEANVTVPLMINDVEDVAVATIKISYDPSVIVVTDVGNSDFKSFTPNIWYAEEGWVKMTGYKTVGGLSGDVKFAGLTIAPRGSYGEISNLSIDVESLSDSAYKTIDATVITGFFYIGMNGDVDANRVVNAADSEYIARGIAGVPGYPPKFGPSEVSGDGIVDAYDCVYLARHAAGLAGYEALH